MSVRSRDDRGAAALVVTASMLVLMGFAALAIDLGSATNERRQDQAASDTGSLAAAQFAKPNPGCSGAACFTQARTNGANEAMAVANASLDDASLANWSNAALCGTPPAGFTVSPVTNCVAFDSNLRRAWVKIPVIASPTYFARIIGFNSVAVSAQSIADTGFNNPGTVLPFLLPGNATGTDYNCLKTGPNPNWGACEDLPVTGNFGSMDFFLYGNPAIGTTEKCNGSTNGRLLSNIARGVDHPLGFHSTGSGAGIEEDTTCPIFSAEPNKVRGQPGVGSGLEDGMLYGGSLFSSTGPYPGRIQDSSGFLVRNNGAGNPQARIDDTPLWSFLKSALPAPCSGITTPAAMISCINWAKATGTEIFEDAIIGSPRFGFTPEVWSPDFLTPGSYYYIKDYRPVYIDTTYYGCDASNCVISHTAGVADAGACPNLAVLTTCGTPGAGNRSLDAVTAYVLSKDILPDVAKTPSPGAENQRRFNLSE